MSKKKIMVVDDEADLTMLLEHIFLSTGLYDVVVANNGHEAKQKAVQEKPDLIFLDFIMPEVRGDEVLKFLRSRPELSETPVVIMSGLGGNVYFDNQEDREEMIDMDFDTESKHLMGKDSEKIFPENLVKKYKVEATLPKPFTSGDLKSMAEKIFQKREKY